MEVHQLEEIRVGAGVGVVAVGPGIGVEAGVGAGVGIRIGVEARIGIRIGVEVGVGVQKRTGGEEVIVGAQVLRNPRKKMTQNATVLQDVVLVGAGVGAVVHVEIHVGVEAVAEVSDETEVRVLLKVTTSEQENLVRHLPL